MPRALRTELQKLGKNCPADETLDLEVLAEDKLLLRHRIGSHPVEQVDHLPLRSRTSRSRRRSPRSPVSLDEAARATLLEALACASDDETRVILNGAYLDVSKPSGHYAVATDGRHLFASNSLHLALPSSVLVPDHRFLSWSGFVKDGQWKLTVQAHTKDKGGYLQLRAAVGRSSPSRSRAPTPTGATSPTMSASLLAPSKSAIRRQKPSRRIVPRLPGDDTPNHTVGLYTVSGRLYLRGCEQGPAASHRGGSARRHRQR